MSEPDESRAVDQPAALDSSADTIIAHVPARAALAGNPSDGYGGAVFALPVGQYRATTTVERIRSGWELVDELSGRIRFEEWSEVERSTAEVEADSAHSLVLATLASVIGRSGTLPSVSIAVDTSIPLSVGLAGSSAIVIATLRALMRLTDDALQRDELASMAWSIEVERLGITAGLQDRVVQTYGQPVLMQFGTDSARTVLGRPAGTYDVIAPGTDMTLLVAHRAGLSEPSQVVHGDLRRRHDDGDARVVEAMDELAGLAAGAADAFASGDVAALGAAMDGTFDLRASMIDLARGHVEMIEAARSAGAHANYSGSGGAIALLCPDARIEAAARQSLKRLGCSIVDVGTDSTPWSAPLP